VRLVSECDERQRVAVVIEDDADIRQLLVIILSSRAFEVHEAVTGAEGQRLLDTVDPSLVTLDLNLPDVDGIDLCARLRADSDAHILTISARPPLLTEEQCLAAGSNHFMAKPFSPRLLGAYLDGVFPREGAPRPHRSTGGIDRGHRPGQQAFAENPPGGQC
jgi:DNA-binding response OmpR family regulator